MRQNIVAALFLTALVLTGCAGSKKSVEPLAPEPHREAALEHYMNGLLLDQKEEYTAAILEYQDALLYSHDPAIYYAIANDYSLIGKHALAIQMGHEAVRLAPDNREYHETLGEIYRRAFELDSAIEEYRQVIRIDSNYAQAWYSLAQLLTIRKPLAALDTYDRIIERFGPEWEAYFQMAQINSVLGRHDKAADAFRGMLRLDPGNFDIKKALGDSYLQQDNADTALKVYEELVELHPENVTLRASIAHAYLVKQDYKHAAEQFETVMAKDTISIENQIQFGQVFFSFIQKDSAVAPVALKLFQSIRKDHPDDWRPYWFLGALANIMRDDSSALENYEKVTKLQRSNPDGWVGVASVWYDRGEFQKAAEILEGAKQFLPEEFRVYFVLGIAYQRMHKATDAALALEHAVQFNEKSIEALSALALVYDELKRYADSDSLYERALALDPHNHLILNNYGYSLGDRGLQLDRALRMSKEAVQQQPNNQSYLDTIGWIYFRLGQLKDAEQWIKKAIDLGKASSVINEHLGDIYSKMNNTEKAIEYWQKALDLDSSNQALKEKIQRGGL